MVPGGETLFYTQQVWGENEFDLEHVEFTVLRRYSDREAWLPGGCLRLELSQEFLMVIEIV